MPPSGYAQVGLPKQTKGIVRPGAVHLSLPLVGRHSKAFDGSEEDLLTPVSSHWRVSAAPNSSASLYSQASYTTSPPMFSENKLDRRRFGIAATPAQDGPWSRPMQTPSPASSTFVLDLKRVTLSANPFMGDEELDDKEPGTEPSGDEKIIKSGTKTSEVDSTTSREATNVRMKKLRMSTRVLGRMLSRRSAHQSRQAGIEEEPLLPAVPAIPPQILISLPSPGLQIPTTPKEDQVAKGDLRTFVLEKNSETPHNRSSTWKPFRPPSPIPKSLRRHGKHKSESSALSGLVVTSPPPPLPVRRQIMSTVRINSPKAVPFASFSTPLSSAVDPNMTSPSWADIQMRLKARALKSSTYAIHNGGIISPTSS